MGARKWTKKRRITSGVVRLAGVLSLLTNPLPPILNPLPTPPYIKYSHYLMYHDILGIFKIGGVEGFNIRGRGLPLNSQPPASKRHAEPASARLPRGGIQDYIGGYKGIYRDHGKEHGNYYSGLYRVWGFGFGVSALRGLEFKALGHLVL